MNYVKLTIALIFSASIAFGQKSNVIFFTENRQPFTLMMNGISYNNIPQTNVKVENLNPDTYSTYIQFKDSIYEGLTDKIKLESGQEVTYTVKYTESSNLDESIRKLSKEIFSTRRSEPVETNTEKQPGKYSLSVFSKNKITASTNSTSTTSSSNVSQNSNSEPETSPYRGSGDPLKGLNVAKAKEMNIGNYYALIIGIDKYKGSWIPLKNAVNDAKAIETTLKNKYKFDNFRILYNEQATRKSIIAELEWLARNAKPSDNVFIYYSGHGEFKQDMNKGFWVPVDAETASMANYISNNDIQTFMTGIKSKHTLLVSDACFSGDIFRGNTISVPFESSEKYYNEVHGLSSRQAMTSGGIEPVMDGGKNGHSVFAYYFLKSLEENNDKYFDAGQLYNKIKIPVVNNSDQTPKLSPIKDTGDEGGQFIFIRK